MLDDSNGLGLSTKEDTLLLSYSYPLANCSPLRITTAGCMKIYVADDHPLTSDPLTAIFRRLLPGQDVMQVAHLEELIQAIELRGAPSFILIALNHPGVQGSLIVRMVRRHFPNVPIAVFSAETEAICKSLCIKAGANFFIAQTAQTSEVVTALKQALELNNYSSVDPRLNDPLHSAVSTRQRQLIAMLADGLSNQQMATALCIHVNTVKYHLAKLFKAFNAKSRTQVISIARAKGLIS